ncbi:MAG TPA: nucleotide exchange factor GrpE [Saprospiraceae bacterium]|nr:nucleotide exchange factor GrpE [Saprospiraceae bacterium]HQW55800.1 nucleotide exchange factor GrpE [Saprospiraceae bacterium]
MSIQWIRFLPNWLLKRLGVDIAISKKININAMDENKFDQEQDDLNTQEFQERMNEALSSDMESDQEQVASMEADGQIAELKDKNLRLFAEFENFRKRTTREKLDLMKTASQDILSSLLPVLDDFDRAKQIVDQIGEPDPFAEGVLLVYDKLNNLLKSKGLEELESTNKEYDPELHEAVATFAAPTPDMKGKVIETLTKGYLLNDKLIRHAKVVVGA